VLPGLIDNHLHIIRGGLNFNMELRWDGVRSLADAMGMLKRQVAITPAPQWVRVVGGFTEHQFAEKRLPTIDELNAWRPTRRCSCCTSTTARCSTALRCAPWATPGHARAARRRDRARRRRQPDRAAAGQAECRHPLRHAGQGPEAAADYQVNSTRHFMRELNRLGVTGAIDAGGGFQNYPDDYQVIQKLADEAS
jgi:predicted amidohydrolase YtcJ